MTPFEYISVALSFVSGLAVAIVLTSAVRAFRARGRTEMDWIPFVWAMCIVLIQFQTWWSMLAYRSVVEWTFGQFGLLVLQMLTFFVASALVLPDDSGDYPDSLRTYFDRDGKWAVAAMATQFALSVSINIVLGSLSLLDPFHLLHLALLAPCLALLSSSRRTVTVMGTVVFGVVTLVAMAVTAMTQVAV
jgi:hypothetical protein